MYAIYASIGVVLGVNVGSPMAVSWSVWDTPSYTSRLSDRVVRIVDGSGAASPGMTPTMCATRCRRRGCYDACDGGTWPWHHVM